jgi:hypothetical protein
MIVSALVYNMYYDVYGLTADDGAVNGLADAKTTTTRLVAPRLQRQDSRRQSYYGLSPPLSPDPLLACCLRLKIGGRSHRSQAVEAEVEAARPFV